MCNCAWSLAVIFTNRFQYTVLNDLTFSDQHSIATGVPQGSELGPFLFLVCINDLPNACKAKTVPYADDSVLLCKENDIQKLKLKAETEFRNTEVWTKYNKISINYNKTNFMLFSRSKYTAVNNFAINTSDRLLTNKNVIKHLGVLFDNELNWEQHIQHVLAKLCIARGVLMKLRHYVPVAALRNIYFGIVYSYLQYGVTSWGNAASKYTTRIQIQQNYIVKILTKTPFFRKKLLPIYSNLNLLKFNNIFNLEVLKFVFKFRSKTLPSCFNE